MYCKFCGNRIASNTTKCTACGANIDLTDGGQSFFDDNELDAWQSDDFMLKGSQTYMPKTEMCEVPDSSFLENYETYLQRPSSSSSSKGSRSQVRRRGKKTILDCLNLSSSNKLIIFCIASALAIVLLVVAIIAVISGGNEQTNEESTQNSGYSQQVGTEANQQTNVNTIPQSTVSETDDNDSNDGVQEQTDNTDTLKDKTEIKDIKVQDEDGKEVSHPVSGYMSDRKCLYLSLDKILKHMGYKNGQVNLNNRNRVLYEHKTNGKVVEIEKGTNMIWVTESGETAITEYLTDSNFNVGDDTYVPIQSFLSKLGYDENKVIWNEDSKTLYFNK